MSECYPNGRHFFLPIRPSWPNGVRHRNRWQYLGDAIPETVREGGRVDKIEPVARDPRDALL